MSPTNARNGSIEMLRLASSVQSSTAAISSWLESGMRNSDSVARSAPATKYGRRRPSRPSHVRSDIWPMIGCTRSPVSGAATQSTGRLSTLDPSDWNIRLMFAFWGAKPIWIPKKPNEIFQSPASDCRGFSIVVALSILKLSPPLSWHARGQGTIVANTNMKVPVDRMQRSAKVPRATLREGSPHEPFDDRSHCRHRLCDRHLQPGAMGVAREGRAPEGHVRLLPGIEEPA